MTDLKIKVLEYVCKMLVLTLNYRLFLIKFVINNKIGIFKRIILNFNSFLYHFRHAITVTSVHRTEAHTARPSTDAEYLDLNTR